MIRCRIALIGLLLLINGSALASGLVAGFRMWHGPDRTRIVFDLTHEVTFKVATAGSPKRLTVELPNLTLMTSITTEAGSGPVLGISTERSVSGDLKVVFDLARELEAHAFMLAPRDPYPYRLVIDLTPHDASGSAQPLPEAGTKEAYLIVIDPGHGGDDPGAIGASGEYEKKVALQISNRLASLINAQQPIRAELTRASDFYISLRDRVQLALSRRADVFVSIHADAAKRASASGASVFVLSEKGAGSELGKWLAERENASDLAGGVDIGRREPVVREALLDMGIDWKVKESRKLARELLNELGQVGDLHSERVESAAFVVLKAIDIPAVLVEAGFMTNRSEERALKDRMYQERLAGALYRALLGYCKIDTRCPHRDLRLGEYIVRSGDTLSVIAARMNVPVAALRDANGLASDKLTVGQTLTLPGS